MGFKNTRCSSLRLTVLVACCRGCGKLASLSAQCPALQSVDATFCSSLTDEALMTASTGMTQLTSLTLAVCRMTPCLCPKISGYQMQGLRF